MPDVDPTLPTASTNAHHKVAWYEECGDHPEPDEPEVQIEAALSALEPVVAGLIEQARRLSVTPDGVEVETTETCDNSGEYGACGFASGHKGNHAVPIGDGVWFGYTPRTGKPTGYYKRPERRREETDR